MALATLEQAKTHLRITLDSDDAQITTMLDVATELCEAFVRGPLVEAEFTAVVDGGRPAVELKRPVTAVTAATENGVALDVATQTTLNSYAGLLYRGTGAAGFRDWGGGTGSVTVTYSAGYETPPAILVHACLETLRHLWETQRGDMPSPSGVYGGDDYVPGMSFSLPRRVTELLDKYRLPSS